jgi:hypothetical protein
MFSSGLLVGVSYLIGLGDLERVRYNVRVVASGAYEHFRGYEQSSLGGTLGESPVSAYRHK